MIGAEGAGVVAAEDGAAARGAAHDHVARRVADHEAGARIKAVCGTGAQDQVRRGLAARAARVRVMRAAIHGIQRAVVKSGLHSPVDVLQRLQRHQAAPDATLVGDQREEKPRAPEPFELRPCAAREAERVPRENEPMLARRHIHDAIAIQEDGRAWRGVRRGL